MDGIILESMKSKMDYIKRKMIQNSTIKKQTNLDLPIEANNQGFFELKSNNKTFLLTQPAYELFLLESYQWKENINSNKIKTYKLPILSFNSTENLARLKTLLSNSLLKQTETPWIKTSINPLENVTSPIDITRLGKNEAKSLETSGLSLSLNQLKKAQQNNVTRIAPKIREEQNL